MQLLHQRIESLALMHSKICPNRVAVLPHRKAITGVSPIRFQRIDAGIFNQIRSVFEPDFDRTVIVHKNIIEGIFGTRRHRLVQCRDRAHLPADRRICIKTVIGREAEQVKFDKIIKIFVNLELHLTGCSAACLGVGDFHPARNGVFVTAHGHAFDIRRRHHASRRILTRHSDRTVIRHLKFRDILRTSQKRCPQCFIFISAQRFGIICLCLRAIICDRKIFQHGAA